MPLGTDPGVGRIGAGANISGSIFGPLGMIAKMDSDGIVADDIDVTTLNTSYSATAALNHFKSYIAGLKDPGTFSFDMLYEATQYNAILSAVGVVQTWTITLPGSLGPVTPGESTISQSGYIKKLGLSVPAGDKMMMPCVMRMSGAITFTLGSA